MTPDLDALEARSRDGVLCNSEDALTLIARVRELEAALEEIRFGKRAEDNEHPLGPDRSMVIRFTSLARAALGKEPRRG